LSGFDQSRLFSILLLLFFLACGMNGEKREYFILAAVKSRPEMELRDLYKLLYQGRFGIGHLIASREGARDYLLEEMASLQNAAAEPLLESCSPDGRMVRVNLRPFLRHSLDPEKLLDAMMETARLTVPDSAAFRSDWDGAGALIKAGKLPFDPAEYARFTREMRERGFPPVHHSEGYSQACHPAYRVVLRKDFMSFFPEASVREILEE
jgi:hypothetical protein